MGICLCLRLEPDGSKLVATTLERYPNRKRRGGFQGDRFEPLFTLYHGRIVPVILEQIDKRVLAPHHLFKIVNTTVLELPKDWPREPSFNTRESLEAFKE